MYRTSYSTDSYLKIPNIIAAAEITNADAIHPGYGFLAENSNFSKICQENNLKFIGASPEMIDGMGDKANASNYESCWCSNNTWFGGYFETYEEAEKLALEIGFPVMLKATAGGGGKGMRAIFELEQLQAAWDSARQEAGAAFGNDGMYMEKLIVELVILKFKLSEIQQVKLVICLKVAQFKEGTKN